jgi:hypothetical protein
MASGPATATNGTRPKPTRRWCARQAQVTIGGQPWIYPSEGQCLECHTEAAGRSLESRTTTRIQHHVSADRPRCSPALTHNAINTLARRSRIPRPWSRIPIRWEHRERSPARGARTCTPTAHSGHRPNGPDALQHGSALFDLRSRTSHACDVAPGSRSRHHQRAADCAGAAARSVVIARMSRRDAQGMPAPRISAGGHSGGSVATQWVNSLTSCN